MTQRLQNVTGTPNIPVSSVTTTAPSIWQVAYSMAHSQIWPTICSGQGSLTAPCLPRARVSFQLCHRKLCVLCYRQDLGSLCTLEPSLKMYQWLQVAPHCGHSQRALLQMIKNTVDALMDSLLVSLQAFTSGTWNLIFQ